MKRNANLCILECYLAMFTIACTYCSLNVNGINLKEKRNRVIEWFKAQKSLITFLQEKWPPLDCGQLLILHETRDSLSS
jgi:exonuclease III